MSEVLAGRYRLGAVLGVGGMARVVHAFDATLEREVAVKLMHAEVGARADGRERFLREARAAASVSHPGLVAVHDVGSADGVPFIVMELVEGPSLAEVLTRRGQLAPAEAIAVGAQLSAALAVAHRRGLIHRDVKPANVLVPGAMLPAAPTDEPSVKVSDFGIAKGLEQAQTALTATGQMLGTPRYLCPEQVDGAPVTPRSDVYSLGVMLYEMLAGQAPFVTGGSVAVALAHRDQPLPPLTERVAGLDADLVAVIEQALEKDPARRFADGAEMRAALLTGRHAGSPPPASASTLHAHREAATTVSLPAEPAATAATGERDDETNEAERDDDGRGRRRAGKRRRVAVTAVSAVIIAGVALLAFDAPAFLDEVASSGVEQTTDEPTGRSDDAGGDEHDASDAVSAAPTEPPAEPPEDEPTAAPTEASETEADAESFAAPEPDAPGEQEASDPEPPWDSPMQRRFADADGADADALLTYGVDPPVPSWMVVLESLEAHDHDPASLVGKVERYWAAGVQAYLLHSDDYAPLNAGYWVIHLPGYDTEDAAAATCRSISDLAPACYPRQLDRLR